MKEGFSLPANFIETYNSNIYPSKYLHSFIIKDVKNKTLLDADAWENSNIFYRKYMSNPNTMFFVNMDDILPDFQTVCDIIKELDFARDAKHFYLNTTHQTIESVYKKIYSLIESHIKDTFNIIL